MEQEEYELVPMGPVRKLEKRVEKIEKTGVGNDMSKELMDIVRTNQKVVDDVIKINSELMAKLNDMTTAVNGMISKIDEFMNRLEVGDHSTETEAQAEPEAPQVNTEVEKRIERLEKRINSVLLATLAKNRTAARPAPPRQQQVQPRPY